MLKSTASTEWVNRHIRDQKLRTSLHSSLSDSLLDRNETISFLRSAQDGRQVSKQEFQDFKASTKQSNRFWTDSLEYVRNLANKVIHGDVANQTYQGRSLGDLNAGSSALHLRKLIDKWFYGGDRPVATSSDGFYAYSYKYAKGSLFQDIDREDIVQGDVGNCYFLASLATVADTSPSTIENMFIDNGDGTFTVRFYKSKGVPDYVTVDRYLPVSPGGTFAYQGALSKHNNPDNELWVALAEKVYAQLNESNWIRQDGTNSYQGIAFGTAQKALKHITGEPVSGRSTNMSFESFKQLVDQGYGITFSSQDFYDQLDASVVADHIYSFVEFDEATNTIRLFNPWGVNPDDERGFRDPGDRNRFKPAYLDLSWDDLLQNFSWIDYVKL